MANTRAIEAACAAVIKRLEHAWRADLFGGAAAQFKVISAQNFASPMAFGVSLFLYRVSVNDSPRMSPSRSRPDDPDASPPLLLDLHFLLTPWAEDASLRHALLGWMMRAIADSPILPGSLLNQYAPDVFLPEETVAIMPESLSTEELFRIIGSLPGNFALSVPYIARGIRIDSQRLENP